MQQDRNRGTFGAARIATSACALIGLVFIPASWFASLDPIVNAAPLFAIAFLILAVAMAAFVRDRIVVVAAALAFLGPTTLIVPEAIGALLINRGVRSDEAGLKIVSINLWTLNGNAAGFYRMIEDERPEIVLLQEAYGDWKKLALDQLPRPYRVVAGYEYPHERNVVIVSKLEPAGNASPYDPAFVTASLRLPACLGGGVVEATSVHLSRPPPMALQLADIGRLEGTASLFGDLAVVGGDFNATPWSSAIRRLDRTLSMRRITRLLPTWPSFWPIAPIDHFFAGEGWLVSEVRLGPNIGSDHRPIVVRLVPRSATPCPAGAS